MTESLSSTVVAHMVGISYRQLDYLIRSGAITVPQAAWQSPRRWTPELIHRLQVAVALNHVLTNIGGPTTQTSQLPYIMKAVMAGSEPAGHWVALRSGAVSYGATVDALFPKSMDSQGAMVVRMPELWP